jgi:hypothetical protein
MLKQENIHSNQATVIGDPTYHVFYSFAPREKIPPNLRERLKRIRSELRSVDLPSQRGLSKAAHTIDGFSDWA